MSKGRLFITGMGGMLGRFLASKAIEEGYEVGGTLHTSTPSEIKKLCENGIIKSYFLDLIEPHEIKKAILDFKPDIAIHLAGRVLGSQDSNVTNKKVFDENTAIIKNTLSAVKTLSNLPRFILVSGCIVYDRLSSKDFVTEMGVDKLPLVDTLEQPYRSSRIEQEKILAAENNLEYIIVRPTQITGPGKIPGVVEYFIAKEVISAVHDETKRTIQIGNKMGEVDIVDVRDAARALLALVERGKNKEIYHLSSGSPETVASLIKVFLETAELKPEEYKIISQNEEKSNYFRFSAEKLRKLGWEPEFELKETVRNYFEYFKERYKYE